MPPPEEERFDKGGRRKVCDYTLNLQADEGLFWSMPTKNFVYSHMRTAMPARDSCLQVRTQATQKYTDAALKGIHWLKKSQNSDGSVYQVYADQRGSQATSPSDPWMRLRLQMRPHKLRAYLLWVVKDFESNYRDAISFVKNQMQSPDGGLYYTNGRFRTNYMMYAWPTMFAIQAIEFAHQSISPKDLF